MPVRKIVEIDESLCNGCGECVVGCAEGALQIIDGKAKIVREDFCDGFGDCIGTCPTGALSIVEREVTDYDPDAARAHVARTRGDAGTATFDAAASRHESYSPTDLARTQPPGGGGCPGSSSRVFPAVGGGVSPSSPNPSSAMGTPPFPLAASGDGRTAAAGLPPRDPGTVNPSDLRQWPIMLHLVPPSAPFLRHRDLCLLSTCSPVAMPDVQWRFVRGRAVVVACPKLDRTEGYVAKLAAILAEPTIPCAVVVRMEVPCCRGLTAMAVQAAQQCGRRDLRVVEAVVATDGRYLAEQTVYDGGASI
jgi:NAD-dependent dihydropyrimidine dehydrogenase PreA subunit